MSSRVQPDAEVAQLGRGAHVQEQHVTAEAADHRVRYSVRLQASDLRFENLGACVRATERAVNALANLYEALQLLWRDRNDSQRYVQLVEGHEALGQAGVFRPQRLYNCAQAAQSTSHSLIFRRRVLCLRSPSSARFRNAGFVMRRLTKCDAGSLAAPAAFAAAHSSLLDDSRAARAAPTFIDTSWARYCKPLLFLT